MTSQYLIFVISAIYTNVFHSNKVSRRSFAVDFSDLSTIHRFSYRTLALSFSRFFHRFIVTHTRFQLQPHQNLNNLDQSTRVQIFSLAPIMINNVPPSRGDLETPRKYAYILHRYLSLGAKLRASVLLRDQRARYAKDKREKRKRQMNEGQIGPQIHWSIER